LGSGSLQEAPIAELSTANWNFRFTLMVGTGLRFWNVENHLHLFLGLTSTSHIILLISLLSPV
jgi:hypothetical protein